MSSYGNPPTEPPDPNPPAAPNSWNLGDALSYGWAKFQANAAQIVVAALILVVAMAVVVGIGIGISAVLLSTGGTRIGANGELVIEDGSGFIARQFVNALVSALVLIVALVVGAGIVRGALGITDGRAFSYQELFKTDKIGPVVIASLIIAAATFVGYLLCFLPGIVVAFLTSYTLYFLIDQDLPPVEAIKASVMFVKDNLVDTLVWYLVGGIIAGIGFMLCGIGALVSVPVVIIGTAYTYRTLTGRPVAA